MSDDLPKIHIIAVPPWSQPNQQPFKYPKYAKDYGVEQDFLKYLLNNYPNLVSNAEEADYVYLPIYWTRLHLNNDYGQSGTKRLQQLVDRYQSYFFKMFTVCQYDDGPLVDLGKTYQFLSSRKYFDNFDAPLLATKIPRTFFRPSKKYIASFSGRFDTHSLRKDSLIPLIGRERVHIVDGFYTARKYSKLITQSNIALSPRGYGGSSFRFYEAIQLGVVPWLIGEIDTRPFKTQIDWNQASFYSPTSGDFLERFNCLDLDEVHEKQKILCNEIRPLMKFGIWPELLLSELFEII